MRRLFGIILLGMACGLLGGPAVALTPIPSAQAPSTAPLAGEGFLLVHADGMNGPDAAQAGEAGVHAAGTDVPCTCRAAGRSFDMGETTCLATPEGLRLARCVMVLNNTSWEIMRTPCPSTRLDDGPSPAG